MRRLAAAFACLALSGCVTATSNTQSPTATEMLLRSHPAERACAELNLHLPAGTKAVLQVAAGDDTPAGKYVVAACRAHLAGRGVALVDTPAEATDVIELRISAAGLDDVDQVWGLSAMTLPAVPGETATSLTTPSISLFSRHYRTGVVELSAVARNVKTGALVSAVGPLWAATQLRNGSVLTGWSYGRVREMPGLVSSASH
ncbi:MAG: DUF6655 family protein [Caulobacteraceae bacterium]